MEQLPSLGFWEQWNIIQSSGLCSIVPKTSTWHPCCRRRRPFGTTRAPCRNLERRPSRYGRYGRADPSSQSKLSSRGFCGDCKNRAHLRFVKILVPEISESVVLDHNAEGQEIT